MNTERSSELQRQNLRDARVRRIMIDLNNPPPNEDMGPTGPLEFEARGNGHSQGQAMHAAELIDDDVVIISPRRFEEAKNNSLGNHSQRNRRGRDNRLTESAEYYSGFSGLTNWFDFTPNEILDEQTALKWDLFFNLQHFKRIWEMVTLVKPADPVLSETEPQPKTPPAFTCTICMDKLIEETSTKCGHIFCKKCIEKVLDTQRKCPTCRHKLTKRDIIRIYLPGQQEAKEL
ncbi:hypothetical protein FNV43_RR01273 [Rhamnella rubrinervis]|uniref:RING-type domain-containing protein n=1 Tax=Rhamnella rubrinervis TaxID=2594499 RepID=A0A8K0MSP6_9ROSA|nr:hypothetical protein FNV43_RR01273 [Rhamnella rubrinervis]